MKPPMLIRLFQCWRCQINHRNRMDIIKCANYGGWLPPIYLSFCGIRYRCILVGKDPKEEKK